MPVVKVTSTGTSTKGKPYVLFNGENTRYYVSNDVETPALGRTIEADTASKRFPNSKFDTWFLNGWKEFVQLGTSGAPAEIQVLKAMEKHLKFPDTGWAIDAGDCSRLLSNVLASCITAGLIKSPDHMAEWVDRVYAYVNGVRSGKLVSFDDRIDWPDDKPKTGLEGPIDSDEPGF